MQNKLRSQHELGVLMVLCAGTFLFFNSYGSINVTLPTIQAEWNQTLSAVQWVSTIGLVMSSSLALGLGRTGDILGRARLYKVGVILYAAGAVLSAAAHSFPELVGFRVIMTLGLSMAMPLASAILVSETSAAHRGLMLGVLLSSGSIGRATGPAVGGLFLALSGWRAVFLANGGLGIIVSFAVWKVLRGSEQTRKESFDIRAALAFVFGYPALLIGISLGAHHGWSSPLVITFFTIGAVGMSCFVLSQTRSKRPLIPLMLLRNSPLVVSLAALLLFSLSYFPILVLCPLYLQNVLGLSPLNLGLLVTTLPLAAAICSPLSGRLADRMDPWVVTIVGLILGACGAGLYATLDVVSDQTQVFFALGLVGAGIGLVLPANQKTVFSSAPRVHYGVLGGMLAVCGPGAGALGIGIAVALVEAIGNGTALQSAEVFVKAQSSAMFALVPLPLVAVGLILFIHSARPIARGVVRGKRRPGS